MKRILLWILATFLLLAVASVISYFLRSDGYGLLEVNDGLIRVGFPFLMFQEGGYGFRREFFWGAALCNLIVPSIAAAFTLGIGYYVNRQFQS
jgi:hypothetical protein